MPGAQRVGGSGESNAVPSWRERYRRAFNERDLNANDRPTKVRPGTFETDPEVEGPLTESRFPSLEGGTAAPNGNLAVALPVESTGRETAENLPAATEYDPVDEKAPKQRNRNFWHRVSLCLVLVVGLVVGLVAWNVTKKSSNQGGSQAVLGSANPYLARFEIEVGSRIYVAGTKYRRTADWIISEDPARLPVDAPNLVQRYLLALFYFDTTGNGEKEWKVCNPPKGDQNRTCWFDDAVLDDPALLFFHQSGTRSRWLSEDHECNWLGVYCDEFNRTRELYLCKYCLSVSVTSYQNF
jgi:hypothetical protein